MYMYMYVLAKNYVYASLPSEAWFKELPEYFPSELYTSPLQHPVSCMVPILCGRHCICMALLSLCTSFFLLFSEVVDEDYIKTLFVSTGGTVVNFRFFQ